MLLIGLVSLLLLARSSGFVLPRFGASWKPQAPKTWMRNMKTSLNGFKDMSAVAFEDEGGRSFMLHCILEGDGAVERMLSDDYGPYTLFLPQEECFNKDFLHADMPADQFVRYHIMNGRVEVPTEPSTTYTMLNGQNITVTVEGNQTLVHGIHNAPVEILRKNIRCANGYIHAISSFLIPDYPEYQPGPYDGNISIYNMSNGVFEPKEYNTSHLSIPEDWYDEEDLNNPDPDVQADIKFLAEQKLKKQQAEMGSAAVASDLNSGEGSGWSSDASYRGFGGEVSSEGGGAVSSEGGSGWSSDASYRGFGGEVSNSDEGNSEISSSGTSGVLTV